MNHLTHVKEIGKTMKWKDADDWVERYKEKNPDATFGWLYGCDILEKLLHYDDSCGIWFFKGLNDDGEERLVMYAADKEGNILNKVKSLGAMAGDGDGGGPPADSGMECPPHCP